MDMASDRDGLDDRDGQAEEEAKEAATDDGPIGRVLS
jgi:hypothetical protein